MKKNILLCGLSGSGKTTAKNAIVDVFGYASITESDMIHKRLRKSFPCIFQKGELQIDSFSYKFTQIITKVIQSIEIIILSRQIERVVLDACHLTEDTRKRIKKLLPTEPIIIKIDCTGGDYQSRFQERKNTEVRKKLHRKQLGDFEEPENINIYYNTSEKDTAWLLQELKEELSFDSNK